MKQETNQPIPLWKELNQKRTQGTATFYPKYEGENVCAIITGNVNWCEILGSYTLDGSIHVSEAKANAQYTALSVNHLHHLAEALEEWLSLKINTTSNGIETIDANNKAERAAIVKAKEALNRISK